MTHTKHTPGKWGFATPIGENAQKNGYAIQAITDDLQGHHIGFVHNVANARLIAAAPDMLAALERMLATHDADVEAGSLIAAGNGQAADQARAAIAKARGQS